MSKTSTFSIFMGLLIGGFVLLYFNLATLTEEYLESLASRTLETEVSIESLDISFQDKTVLLEGLRIANPQGYGFSKNDFMLIEKIFVDAEILSGEVLVFNKIEVAQSEIHFEMKNRKNNISVLKKSLEKQKKSESAKPSAEPKKEKPSESAKATSKSEDVKVIIKSFEMNGVKMTPEFHDMPVKFGAVSLPSIHLTDIGQKENGIIAREAVAQIFNHILTVARRSASREGFVKDLPSKILDKAQQNIGEEKTINKLKRFFGE